MRRPLRARYVVALATAVFFAADAGPAHAVDLAKVYPATREWSPVGLTPICTADDVWEISSFRVSQGRALVIEGGPCTVAFGRDGTDVLWAVVLPQTERPIRISGSLARENEQAQSVLLRFAPSAVGQMFPEETVLGRGDPWLRYEAQRIASRKMVWRWCTPAGNPTIVPGPVTIIDVDTVQGPRRFWVIDRNEGRVLRINDFVDQPTPPLRPIEPGAAVAAFDEAWSAFDREYAKFVDLPDVNWQRLRETYRPAAEQAETTFALAAVLADMLAQLKDLHIWVRDGDDFLPGYVRQRPLNANWAATRAHLADPQSPSNDLTWGRTGGGVGYLGVDSLTDERLPQHIDAALESLRDTKGLIIDLRFNGGGDELLARAVAGRFTAEPVIYSRNQYRSGPHSTDLGPMLDRVLEPRGPWRYEGTVVCLIGPRTFSSAESLAAMFAVMPHVQTIGSPTGGSSANPRRLKLDCGIEINLPRWRDLLPDGTPIEGRGVPPRTRLEFDADEFTDERDPLFEAALALLDAAR